MLGEPWITATGREPPLSVTGGCSTLSARLLASEANLTPLSRTSLPSVLLLPAPDNVLGSVLLTSPAANGLVSSEACSVPSHAGSHHARSSCMETPSGHTGS